MKVYVEQNICVGSQECVKNCPEVFKMEDGKSHAYIDSIPKNLEEKVSAVEQGCPVSAIKVKN